MKRHFILTAGRSGSNYLANTLNHHPNILNYGEVLGEWTLPYKVFSMLKLGGMGWESYLDALYDRAFPFYLAQAVSARSHLRDRKKIRLKQRGDVETIGLKDFSFLIHKRGLTNYLIEHEDIQIVHLHRNNLLKRYISLLRMSASGLVKSERGMPSREKVSCDTQELEAGLKILTLEESDERKLIEAIGYHRVYRISYEDYFSSGKMMVKHNSELLEFLGVPQYELVSEQVKLSSDDLEHAIQNYDEVCGVLHNTEYERYLYM